MKESAQLEAEVGDPQVPPPVRLEPWMQIKQVQSKWADIPSHNTAVNCPDNLPASDDCFRTHRESWFSKILDSREHSRLKSRQ